MMPLIRNVLFVTIFIIAAIVALANNNVPARPNSLTLISWPSPSVKRISDSPHGLHRPVDLHGTPQLDGRL